MRRAIAPSGSSPVWVRGIRNAIGISLPLLIGISWGDLSFWVCVSIGAYLAAFADDEGGAFPTRIRSMVNCTIGSAISFVIGTFAAPYPWLAVFLICLWTFGWGLLAGCGRAASLIGAMSATAILFASEGIATTGQAFGYGFGVLIGGLFIVAMTMMIWPFARSAPAQRELGEVRIAVHTVIAECTSATDITNEKNRQRALATIATARGVIADSFRATEPVRAQMLAQVRAAERCVKLAAALRFETAGRLDDPITNKYAYEQASALQQQLDDIFDIGVDPEIERSDHPTVTSPSFIQRFKTVLNPAGNSFLYAIRFTIVAGAGLVLATLAAIPHDTWIAVTSWRVLRPSYAVTMTRAHQRVIGNVLGGVVAAVLLWITPINWIVVVIIAVFSFLCFSLRPVNYGYYATFASVVILMLIEITDPGDFVAAIIRILATIAGAVLAILGVRFVLPRWTANSAASAVRTAIKANRDYALAIAQAFRGHYDRDLVTNCRRAADTSNNNAYSMLDQIRHEPVTTTEQLQAAEQIVVANLRLRDCLVGVISRRTLDSVDQRDDNPHGVKSWRSTEDQYVPDDLRLADALEHLADSLGRIDASLAQQDATAQSMVSVDLTELLEATEALLPTNR